MASQTVVLPILVSSNIVKLNNLQLWLPLPYTMVLIGCLAVGKQKRITWLDIGNAAYCFVFLLSAFVYEMYEMSFKIRGSRFEPSAKRPRSHRIWAKRFYRGLFTVCGTQMQILYTWNVYTLKYYATGFAKGCDLNTAEENEWTLGQIYAVVMLVVLLLPLKAIYSSKSFIL